MSEVNAIEHEHRLTMLETHVSTMAPTLTNLQKDVHEIAITMAQAKGWVLGAIAIFSTIGGSIANFFTHMFGISK